MVTILHLLETLGNLWQIFAIFSASLLQSVTVSGSVLQSVTVSGNWVVVRAVCGIITIVRSHVGSATPPSVMVLFLSAPPVCCFFLFSVQVLLFQVTLFKENAQCTAVEKSFRNRANKEANSSVLFCQRRLFAGQVPPQCGCPRISSGTHPCNVDTGSFHKSTFWTNSLYRMHTKTYGMGWNHVTMSHTKVVPCNQVECVRLQVLTNKSAEKFIFYH